MKNQNQNQTPKEQCANQNPAQYPSTTTGEQRPTPPKVEASEPVIFTYSRKEALADGVQVDVTSTAKFCGFKIPVFLTASVYHDYVEVPEGDECQDEAGRLWDVLSVLYYAVHHYRWHTDHVEFQVCVRNDNRGPQLVTLHAVCEALDFDDLTPAITVTLPNED